MDDGRVLAEIDGSLVLDAAGGPFTLRARADRIDVGASSLIVTDYKTGALPNDTAVCDGWAPQLPLEAAIVAAGGFTHIEARTVSALRYIRATGGEPPGEERVVKRGDVKTMADEAIAGLRGLIDSFDDPRTPYRPTLRVQFAQANRFDSYVHLARTAEWSVAEDDEEESEEP